MMMRCITFYCLLTINTNVTMLACAWQSAATLFFLSHTHEHKHAHTHTHTHNLYIIMHIHKTAGHIHVYIHIYTLCCVSITSISLVCVHSCVPVTECQSCVYIHVHCAVCLSVSLCISLMYITLLAVSYICSTVVELINLEMRDDCIICT